MTRVTLLVKVVGHSEVEAPWVINFSLNLAFHHLVLQVRAV